MFAQAYMRREKTGRSPNDLHSLSPSQPRYQSPSTLPAERCNFAAAIFSSRCFTEDVPGIGSITGE